jgi:activator of HSP90 ATPase
MKTMRTAAPTPSIASSRRQLITGASLAIGGLIVRSPGASAEPGDGISHSADSIHQEPAFTANRHRVYEALTDAQQFDKVTQLSGVMQSAALAGMKKPTDISRQAGGTFALFGGYIVGRHIELIPDELVVQAWRTAAWARGIYSIVRFELVEQGSGTQLKFDHTGFPNGEAEHLAAGWQANYWRPIEKLLAHGR